MSKTENDVELDDTTDEEVGPEDAIEALQLEFGERVPSRAVIEGWKDRHGNVHVYVSPQDEFYLFRPLTRLEHRNMRRDLIALEKSASAAEDPNIVEDQTQERVLKACVLVPRDIMSPEALNQSPAGLFPTLYNLVMQHSNFLSAQDALRSVLRL